jgi:hypothetical protein
MKRIVCLTGVVFLLAMFIPGLSLLADPPPIKNGDFELGPDGSWTVTSTNGLQDFVIVHLAEYGIPNHDGYYSAWLGGDPGEVTTISQQITIPGDATHLSYWFWIDSNDSCGKSFGWVFFDTTPLRSYDLCQVTTGWTNEKIDISAYQGLTKDLIFKAQSAPDPTRISSLFIDSILLECGAFCALDHFDFSAISSPQTVGVPFSVTVTAKDAYGNAVTDFTGSVSLTATIGNVSPASFSLTSGTGNGYISLNTAGDNIQITASANGKQGQTNPFNVQNSIDLPGAFSKSSPTTGATNQSTSPTLTWGASTGVTSYEYCYDTTNDNACSSWTSNGASTSVSLSGLANNTTYYWQVRANNTGGTTYSNSSSTAFWSFTTVVPPPAAFSKVSPGNGTVNQSTNPILTWSDSIGAISYEYCYDRTNDNACDSGIWISSSNNSSYDLLLIPGTTYYWQVRARSAAGTTNADGGTWWSFTTSPVVFIPNATTNPAIGITNSGATLNGTVNPNNGSTTVTFQYGLTTAYGSTVTADQSPVTGDIDTPVSKGITGLSANTTYHYRVVADSSAGTTNGGDQPFKTLAAPTPGNFLYLPLILR